VINRFLVSAQKPQLGTVPPGWSKDFAWAIFALLLSRRFTSKYAFYFSEIITVILKSSIYASETEFWISRANFSGSICTFKKSSYTPTNSEQYSNSCGSISSRSNPSSFMCPACEHNSEKLRANFSVVPNWSCLCVNKAELGINAVIHCTGLFNKWYWRNCLQDVTAGTFWL
jgi:hypothetical protein